MRRREFLYLLSVSAAARARVAFAEASFRRISVMMHFPEDHPEAKGWAAAFHDGLQQLGWVEGSNLRSWYFWATEISRIRQLAKEIVRSNPDLILSSTSTTTLILKDETRTIPVIFANIVDPIGQGLVASWAKPGGNFTGFVNLEPSVISKYVELLKAVAPRLTLYCNLLQSGR